MAREDEKRKKEAEKAARAQQREAEKAAKKEANARAAKAQAQEDARVAEVMAAEKAELEEAIKFIGPAGFIGWWRRYAEPKLKLQAESNRGKNGSLSVPKMLDLYTRGNAAYEHREMNKWAIFFSN